VSSKSKKRKENPDREPRGREEGKRREGVKRREKRGGGSISLIHMNY
jgi:hypothetical protein